MAKVRLQGERDDHSLSATDIAHEAYLRLARNRSLDWKGKAHILAAAAVEIRRVLIDYARKHRARAGGFKRVTVASDMRIGGESYLEILALHEALDRLAKHRRRCARVVELRVFAGMIIGEVATVLEVSKRTVDDDWAYGKAWLARELRGQQTAT